MVYVIIVRASQVALVVKNSPANAGDAGSVPGSGRFPGGGNGNPLQYSSNHTRTTALSNSMKLSHARGATQEGRVMVERSDRMWSTGEGNGKPLQYSCLENPMNSMKRQKDRALKEELPRSEVPNMLLEISGEITPERMKGWSQSKNNTQVGM